jgi:aldehyde dehydrogenase (NAD+)
MIENDLVDALNHLDEWTADHAPEGPLTLLDQLNKPRIHYDPLGVVLNIVPWNYPIQLALVPLVGAIAAGNAMVIKPSELAPASAEAVSRFVERHLDADTTAVVQGAIPETTHLLQKCVFDHILYTGAPAVAKIVMRAAAENLTPVTLELGGKSPTIVAADANIPVAARRIAWGRFVNAGQTCLASDYVLVPAAQKQELMTEIAKTLVEFYGEDPADSPHYVHIINERHHQRLTAVLAKDRKYIHSGGETDEDTLYIEPTVLDIPSLRAAQTAESMQDELFGPLLPVITCDSLDDAIAFVNARPKPLALYVFSESSAIARRVTNETSSGSMVVNDTLMQATCSALPFGGVGNSGMGAYHGVHSFRTFSHTKSMMIKDTSLEVANKLRYPPYTDTKLSILSTLGVHGLRRLPAPLANFLRIAIGVAALAVIIRYFYP